MESFTGDSNMSPVTQRVVMLEFTIDVNDLVNKMAHLKLVKWYVFAKVKSFKCGPSTTFLPKQTGVGHEASEPSEMSTRSGNALRNEEDDHPNYLRNMILNFSSDLEKRRRRDDTIKSDSDVEPGHLKVDIAELYARDNSKEHHTELYELVNDASPTPVLRRGLPFFFALRFDRAYDVTKDSLRLQFDLGPRPAVTKETRVVLPVTDKKEMTPQSTQWDVKIHRVDDKTVTLQVEIPATAQVGLWRCLVQTSFIGSNVKNDFLCKDDIYILFNPWCPDDAVFMDHEDNRKEYVLNETGKVWTGSARRPLGRRWIFGQFDDAVLPGAMYLLELSKLSHAERGSPVKIARAISTVINANDDLGLLVGNWSNDYRDGVAPHSWTGSVAIFEQYLKSGGRSVKYGQCWVFSAATVTALFRCGPASVEAVKRGKVGLAYDTPFIFAEVNADVCHFQEDKSSDWGFSALNINQYTLPLSGRSRFRISNKSEESRTVSAVLSASSVYYTGITVHLLKKAQRQFVLQPNQRESPLKDDSMRVKLGHHDGEVLQVDIGLNEYLDKMVDHGLVKIYAMANVQETKQTWGAEDDFSFKKPKLNVQCVQDTPRVGQESQVTFSFLNPLPVLLTECQFTIEGHGLQRPKNVNYRAANIAKVRRSETMQTNHPTKPLRPEAGAHRTTQVRSTTGEIYQTKQTNKARTSYVFPAHSPPLWVVCSPVRSTKDSYHNLVKTPARRNWEGLIRGSEPAFAWKESGKPFRKTNPSSPNRDSNLDLPILSSRAQHYKRVSQLRHREVWYARTTARFSSQSALRPRHELVLEEQLFVEKASSKEYK
uniref:Transglutaminase N-terminal domain-containing protein n=1 Tax=Timema cristinae TaxID=61476 RepID=A0A7R9GR56_TIMCR|nr:unnamed protein product [Timema cristinae]